MTVGDPRAATHDAVAGRRSRRWRIACIAAVAATVFAAKLVLVHAFGSDLAFRDQWDAEAATVFLPYLSGGFGAVDWFARHNEHVILWSKLWSVALYEIDGQWDGLVQTTANAALHVACAAILAGVAARLPIAATHRASLLLLVAVGFASPYGWENTIGAFQSPFCFLLLATFAMLSIASRERHRPIDRVALAALAVAAQFTMAAGAFAAVAAAACLVVRMRDDPDGRRWRWALVALLTALAIAQVGFALDVRSREPDGERTVAAFLHLLIRALGFPTTLGAPLMWLPWCLLVRRSLGDVRTRAEPAVVFVLGLGVFVILVAGGIAFERAGDGVASRYKDLLWLGGFVNVAALSCWPRGRDGALARIAMPLATIGLTGALLASGFGALDEARERRRHLDASVGSVSAFVATGDLTALAGTAPGERPYPRADFLAFLLSDASIRAILPPSVRPGLLDARTAAKTAAPSSVRMSTGPDASTDIDVDAAALAHATRTLAVLLTGNGPGSGLTMTLQAASSPPVDLRMPKTLSPDRWTAVTFAAPRTPFRLRVEAKPGGSPLAGFAIRGPVEIGPARVVVDALLHDAQTLFAVSLAALLVVLIFALDERRGADRD